MKNKILNWTYAKSLIPRANQLELGLFYLKEMYQKVHREKIGQYRPRLVGLGRRELWVSPVNNLHSLNRKTKSVVQPVLFTLVFLETSLNNPRVTVWRDRE